jgi:hypothetical protein
MRAPRTGLDRSQKMQTSDFEDYLLAGHLLSMGFAGSAVISRAAQ